MLIHFAKMHGLGNDFVVIDRLSQQGRIWPDQIKELANRKTGIGFDQLLEIGPPDHPDVDFSYRIYNADGREVEQCGNGARCIARFAYDKHLTYKKTITASTLGGRIKMTLLNNRMVKVDMGKPRFDPKSIPIEAKNTTKTYTLSLNDKDYAQLECVAVSMGNPHAVIQVPNVRGVPVKRLGSHIEKHEFFPQGVNVEFMEVVSRHRIRLRVFERGVGETEACGSGACAAVVAGRMLDLLDEEVIVDLPGGELTIENKKLNKSVFMTGPAITVYEGRIRL